MKLTEILKLKQTELLATLKKHLSANGYTNNFICTDKYLFAKGKIPIMLVAHLDTVHTKAPTNIFYDKDKKVMWSPEGIGGDDRCGVFAILEIIKEYNPYILFTTDEEKGGLGASQFSKEYCFELWNEIKYIIEIDRRGKNQAVFYKCGNKKFKEYVLSFGFNEMCGTFSDISVISPDYDIASVNLSAGYYNEHTLQEYINVDDLFHTVKAVKKMLADNEKQTEYFDYQETLTYFNTQYKEEKKEEKKPEKVQKETIETEDVWNQIEQDWYDLSAEEFRDIWGFKKPATIDELYGF